MDCNYRVVRRRFPDGRMTGIYEVWYGRCGRPESVGTEPVRLESGDGRFGLTWMLERVREALDLPVLDWDVDFPLRDEPDPSTGWWPG